MKEPYIILYKDGVIRIISKQNYQQYLDYLEQKRLEEIWNAILKRIEENT